MKKIFLKIFILMMITALFCSCFEEEKIITTNMLDDSVRKSDSNNKQPKKNDASSLQDSIEKKLNSLTLEEKIGQMVMIGFQGTELNEDIIFSMKNFHFGGVIFFDRNLVNSSQAKQLMNDIEKNADSKVPIFFAIDEEGGTIVRGKDFLEPAPSQESIGLDGNPETAEFWAKHNATILKNIGINLNFAPVADVGSNDTRSFGYDAQLVSQFVDASARGYEEEKFLYTLKHFPGIGKSKIDPHKEISNIDDSRNILEQEDFPPFREVIRKHDNSKFMVMVGHLKYDALDSVNPASLSPVIITKLLREDMGFKGVVITDDLEMGAIQNNVDLPTIGVKMVLAGGDIALVCHNYASQQIVYNSILEAVKHGEISQARIDESVRRILRMKANLTHHISKN